MRRLDTELETALKATEASFHVRLIGTFAPDLVWAPPDAKAAPWLASNRPEFDQFPVKQGDATVGVLLRQDDHGGKTVFEAMQPLREGLIVSADMPIAHLIPQLGESHYRVILRGSQIDGLVTQSDLLKLPVRMLLFGLISHLEICLRALVRKRAPWPEWLELLEPKRRKEISKELADLKNSRIDPDPLEFTNLSDVPQALAQQPDLDNDFRTDMDSIRNLRNHITHARTYIRSADDVCKFADLFNRLRDWIGTISEKLKSAK